MRLLKFSRREMLLTLAVVVIVLAVAIFTLPKLTGSQSKATVGELLGTSNRTAPGVTGTSITDTQISVYQDKLRTKGDDPTNLTNLGLAYLQKAREAGDPVFYTKAEQVLKKALELNPSNASALGGMGSLSLSRHQFGQGLEWGQKAQALAPTNAYNLGVIGDAQVELGRYDEALQTVQKMVNLRPDISSYSRVSYLRELYGQYDAAIEAMQQAVDAGAPQGENRAWVTYQLGNLYFNKGDLTTAEGIYQQALLVSPSYVYAEAGLGRIKAAHGDLDAAIAQYTSLTQRIPLAEFIIELGDLYTAANKPAEAAKQYDLVRAIQKIYTENGVDTDLEMALFNADHDYNLPEALDRAKREMNLRPSIKAADVLAWTLYKTGDYQGAWDASQKALRLGTQDSLMYFHAGMIASKLGKTADAHSWLDKALAFNPNFSLLYVPVAKQMLGATN